MAKSPRPLPKRSHQARRTPEPLIGADIPDGCTGIDAAILEIVVALKALLHRGRLAHCGACGRDIDRGHTAYLMRVRLGVLYLLCYECGEAAAIGLGIIPAGDPPWCQPYGGPPP